MSKSILVIDTPSSCSECNVFRTCKLYSARFRNRCNPNCPLISIDIEELEEAINILTLDLDFSLLIGDYSPDENIVTETLKIKKEQNKDKAIKTIKATIDKLKGVK